MKYLIIYTSVFILLFILYRLYFYLLKKYRPNKRIMEVFYLESKYKVVFDKTKNKGVYNYISIINALIITVGYVIINVIDVLIWQIIFTIIATFVLIYILYSLLGYYYKSRR